MAKKFSYYHLDTGFYPSVMKLCFSNDQFHEVLEDHGIHVNILALDYGVAETHKISLPDKSGLIILVFDISEIGEDSSNIAGIVSHEVSHAVDKLAEYIGEDNNLYDGETRAYLTEHLVRQVVRGYEMELEKNVRKTSGSKTGKRSKKSEGGVIQMDLNNNGSSGSNSDFEPPNTSSGTENTNRSTISEAEDSIQRIGGSRISSDRPTKRG